jgi:pimeloyl-ACP methyl ester carboxylesterase
LTCLYVIGILLLVTAGQGAVASAQEKAKAAVAAADARVSEKYGRLTLHFEANRGQTHEDVRFLSRGPGYSVYLTASEAVLVVAPTRGDGKRDRRWEKAERGAQEGAAPVVLRMALVDAHPKPPVTGIGELPGKANYFIGRDPAKWRTNIPTYEKVYYREVYPGIDLVYYGDQRQLRYDFVVRAGADPERIALDFQGADRLEIDAQGDLVLHVAGGAIRQPKPVIYQEIDGLRQEIRGGYVLTGSNRVRFQIAAYDRSRPLVIDPTLVYSTYLGGGDSDVGEGLAVDATGHAYVTGWTWSLDFPTTPGAVQPTLGGWWDAFVAKLDPTGSALVYSTYLGGSNYDEGRGLAVDATGHAYVTGYTGSPDFPTTPGAVQPTLGGWVDAFVTRLDLGPPTTVPVLTVSPSSLVFGPVPVGGSKDLTFTVQNTGGGTLEGSCTTAVPFSLPEGCTFSLPAGQSKPVKVRFSPASVGTFIGNVSFTSNGGTAFPTVAGIGIVSDLTDTDGNGLPDDWELRYFGAIGVDPQADPDGDGILNGEELGYGTNPVKADTDDDGWRDGDEIAQGTDPRDPGSYPTPPPAKGIPLIFIPGIYGTELWQGEKKVWPVTAEILRDCGDEHLGVLRPGENGEDTTGLRPGLVVMTTWGTDVYGDFFRFLLSFESQGYRVFLFPYDWRLDLRRAAEQLADVIEGLRKTGSSRVDIVAHSMGGLVAKAYLNQRDETGRKINESKVRNVIMIATPHFGAPKALSALLFGEDDVLGPLRFAVDKDQLAHIATNMPAAYQLLPSYLLNLAKPAFIDQDDFDGDGKTGGLGYSDLLAMLANQENRWKRKICFEALYEPLNPNVREWVAPHNGPQGWDLWTPSDPGLRAYLFIGKGLKTLGAIEYKKTLLGGGFKADRVWLKDEKEGDETVPAFSAGAGSVPGFTRFEYTSEWGLCLVGGNVVPCIPPDKKGDHFGLLANSKLREQISTILRGASSSAGRASSRGVSGQPQIEGEAKASWIEVALDAEVATLHLFDVLGNHVGPTPQGGTERNIAASQYLELGEVKVAVLPQGGLYTLKIQATGAGEADLRITEYVGADPVQVLHYLGIPLGPSGQAQMTLREVSPTAVLEVDENGDGITDRQMIPFNPPVANAGLDQTVNEGDLVRLDGTKSVAPEGNPLTYWWTQTAGPSVTLSDPTAATPTFRAPFVRSPTLLTFQLTVSDGQASSSDTVPVTVQDLGASIRGTVTGSESRPIAGAKVTLLNPRKLHTTVTDGAGFYAFPALDPGRYTVKVTHPDFRTQRRGVKLALEEDKVLNFTLKPKR